MPDLFISQEEKPQEVNTGRNRAPVSNQTTAPISDVNPTPAQPQEIEKETEEEIAPITENIIINNQPPQQSQPQPQAQTNDSSDQELPFSEEIEKRNGMLPIFASFWQNPKSIYFDTQEPDEHILLFLRRHFVTNSPWITFTILLLFLPLLAIYILQSFNYSFSFLPQPLTQIILILYYLLVLTNAFVNFLDWYYNISIITSKRVLDIQLKDLVNKKVSATKINLIQDVDFKQTGTIPSIFNYGDVFMQTAGKDINFVADAVPNPEYVVQVVESLIGKEGNGLEGGENATD